MRCLPTRSHPDLYLPAPFWLIGASLPRTLGLRGCSLTSQGKENPTFSKHLCLRPFLHPRWVSGWTGPFPRCDPREPGDASQRGLPSTCESLFWASASGLLEPYKFPVGATEGVLLIAVAVFLSRVKN